jgi:hypothetical protein
MKFRTKIQELTQTCFACPSQWEGNFENGDSLYIRYRHSHLRVDRNGTTIFEKDLKEDDGGVMNTEEMLKITGLKMRK